MRKEFLRESEGTLEGERSVPKLHCCNISHGGESEKSHRCLVEMSGMSLTLDTIKTGRDAPDRAGGEKKGGGGLIS